MQTFIFGESTQFRDLSINTQDLFVFNIGALASIQKEFLRWHKH
ncbi:MAG: hypothetical protein ACKKL4_02345 [Patescibacteria group bacterium]